jgi:hypothetical protein
MELIYLDVGVGDLQIQSQTLRTKEVQKNNFTRLAILLYLFELS